MTKRVGMKKGDLVIYAGQSDQYETDGNMYTIEKVDIDSGTGKRLFTITNNRGKAWLKKWEAVFAEGKDAGEPVPMMACSVLAEDMFRPLDREPTAEELAMHKLCLKS